MNFKVGDKISITSDDSDFITARKQYTVIQVDKDYSQVINNLGMKWWIVPSLYKLNKKVNYPKVAL